MAHVLFVFEEACYVAQHQKQSSCDAVNESRHGGSLVRTHQLANVCLMFMRVSSVCNVVHVFVGIVKILITKMKIWAV